MSDVDRIVEGLELFNEKVDKLLRQTFIKAMLQPDSGITLSWRAVNGGGYEGTHERRGPGEEAIDAFVLNFRYFIQDNEMSSLRMMADHYKTARVEDSLKKEFSEGRKQINDFLNGNSPMKYNAETLTRHKIMDTFVYGGLSHATKSNRDPELRRISENKKLYDAWMSIPPFRHLIENEFVNILANILDALVHIKSLNEKALAQLKSTKSI